MSRVVTVNPSLVVERVGSDYLMLTASGAEVVRATGDAADVITCAINGQPLPDRLHTAADVLQRHGVLTTTTSVTTTNTFTPSRRHALQLGAAAAAVGLTMLALPNAAAAASEAAFTYTASYNGGIMTPVTEECYLSGGASNFDVVFRQSGSFVVTAGSRDATISLIGGGGSGSSPAPGGGGGGGGGTVGDTDEFLLTVGTYVITVGAGGAAVTGPSDGLPGEDTTVYGDGVGFIANGGRGGVGGEGGDSGTAASSGGAGLGYGGTGEGPAGGGGGGAGGDGDSGNEGRGGSGGGPGILDFYGAGTGEVAGGGGGGGSIAGGTGGGAGGNGAGFVGGATAGATNTGSGGGGGYNRSASGAGGSGIVVIRFFNSSCPVPA